MPFARKLHVIVWFAVVALCGCGGGGSNNSPAPPPVVQASFSVSASPQPIMVLPGGSNSISVTIHPIQGTPGTVTVDINGLPTGVSASPASFTASVGAADVTQLATLSATSSAANGSFSPSIAASGTTWKSSFALAVNVEPLTSFTFTQVGGVVLRPGQSQTVNALVLPNGDGGYVLDFGASGLPSGETASFSPASAEVGKSITLTLTASPNTSPDQHFDIKLTATRPLDNAQSTGLMRIDVAYPLGQTPPSRHDFLPLTGTPTSAVYDPNHRLIFANNPDWNRIEVVSVDTKTVVRSIPLVSPARLDLSPDGSTVWVGTWTRHLFGIDTTSLHVVKDYVLPLDNEPMRLLAAYPVQVANGKVLLIETAQSAPYRLVKWDLMSGTVEPVKFLSPGPAVDGITKSADGSKALVWSSSTSGFMAVYDSAGDSFQEETGWGGNNLSAYAISPDGKQMIALDPNGLALYDTSFNLLGYFPGVVFGGALTGAVYSPDLSKIYLVLKADSTPTVATIDTASLAYLGSAPAIPIRPPLPSDTDPPFGVSTPVGADSTGVVFGFVGHGIAFEDAAYIVNYTGEESTPLYNNAVIPRSGKMDGTTRVSLWWGSTMPGVSDAWFEDLIGLNPGFDGMAGQLFVNAPPSSVPGPVNVKVIEPNGTMVFNAQAFSYGPYIQQLVGNIGSTSGGETIDLLVLGVPDDGSGTKVSIGGANAPIVSAKRIWYPYEPLMDLQVTVPPGQSGLADVKISNDSGSMTLPKAFRYAAASNYFGTGGYTFVLYDRFQNRLFLSARDHVDVFSLKSRSFSAPITVPSVNGEMQLGGLSLIPDGSKLLVTNTGDGSVAIVDPDNPSNVKAVAVMAPGTNGECARGPLSIAATTNGKAILTVSSAPWTGHQCGPDGELRYVDYNAETLATGPLDNNPGTFTLVYPTRDNSFIVTNAGVGPGSTTRQQIRSL